MSIAKLGQTKSTLYRLGRGLPFSTSCAKAENANGLLIGV